MAALYYERGQAACEKREIGPGLLWMVESWKAAVRAKYRRRLEKLVTALKQVGFDARMPGGTYFVYVKAPAAAGGQTFANAEEASQYLIREQSLSCVPWDDAGAFLRFSVTYIAPDEAAEDVLMAATVARLRGLRLRFA